MAKLKIQHTRTGAAGYENGATIVEDSYVSPTQVDGNYIGGTGGFTTQTIPTIQPSVKVRSETATTGSIIAQKGFRKFLVSDENTVQDENIIAGQTYRISLVSGTDWSQFGAGANANTNDIFTAAINGSAAVVNNGQVQNVSTCTLVNKLASELTTANTMTILVTASEIAGANVANIGPGQRTSAYITYVTGNVTGVSTPVVGYQIAGTSLTGNVTVTAINSVGNITVSCDDQSVSNEQAAIDVTFNASRITNKYVYDWSDTPNKYRYWFANPSSSGAVLASQPSWQGTTFVKVNNA